MKPERQLIDLMRYASLGHNVAIISVNSPNTTVNVGRGTMFFRCHARSGLLTIRVDTVWFMDYPVSEEVERLGIHLTRLSKEPRIIKGDETSEAAVRRRV